MSFKINKTDLAFALELCSKALAQRQQEEMIYRSVRLQTFENDGKYFVSFASNGGHNAVLTAGFPIIEYRKPIDVLVECQKLYEVVSKATVDIFSFELQGDVLVVKANGQSKLRYFTGDTIAEFATYSTDGCLGEIKVKDFLRLCRLTSPFSTDDIHRAPLIGLCIEKNTLYATDEYKSNTLLNIGLNISQQLNFNPIAADMVKAFDNESVIRFYLGKISSANYYTHLVLVVDGIEMYVLKYKTEYPSAILDNVNSECKRLNVNSMTFSKSAALQVLSRIEIFTDDNNLLAITPLQDRIILQVMNADTNEESYEELEAKIVVDRTLLEQKLLISLKDFKVILNTLDSELLTVCFGAGGKFLSIIENNFVCWFMTKNIV